MNAQTPTTVKLDLAHRDELGWHSYRVQPSLTNPGYALARRIQWQRRMERVLTRILNDETVTFTSGSGTGTLEMTDYKWSRVMRRLLAESDLPQQLARTLATMEPEPETDVQDTIKYLSRTLGTASYNAFVLTELAALGFERKAWLCRHDARTRPSHRQADKQTQPLSRPFTVGGEQLMFPGDARTAGMEEWASCRCAIIGVGEPTRAAA